jgi:uncharacterized protein YkwD
MRIRLFAAIAAVTSLASPSSVMADSDCPNAYARPDQISVSDYQTALLCVVNETRRDWDRGRLTTQRNLTRAAGWQAADMTQKDYFSHTQPDGDTFADRLERVHFIPSSDHWAAGENLAAGHDEGGSAAAIVGGWMNSREHRINLLDPNFDLVGIAASRGWPGPGAPDSGSLTIAMDLGWRHR